MDVRAMNQVGREAPLLMHRRQEEEALRRPRIVIAAAPASTAASGLGSVSLGSSAADASVIVSATPGKTQEGDAAHLKKQRRNERDRHRSLLKRVRPPPFR